MKIILYFTLIIFFSASYKSQVTIGSLKLPVEGAILDLKEIDNTGITSTRGIGLPRVLLEEYNSLEPCVNNPTEQDKINHTGLIVYNIFDQKSDVCPGLSVWNGQEWKSLNEKIDYRIGLDNPNSYILKPGESTIIPVNKVYSVWNKYKLSYYPEEACQLISGKISVSIVWQDMPELIKDLSVDDSNKKFDALIKVSSNLGKEGNALIAIHIGPNGDNTDPIRWNWHIWVTDYNPDFTTNTDFITGDAIIPYNNGSDTYVFMDRNLGAISAKPADSKAIGLYYQWGRKDPFPPDFDFDGSALSLIDGNGSKVSITSLQNVSEKEKINLLNSLIQPLQIITGGLKDWYTISDDPAKQWDERWGHNTQKSPFDPCPKGWRVPDYKNNLSPWTKPGASSYPGDYGINASDWDVNKGWYFTDSTYNLGYYPASGYRYDQNNSVGVAGYEWTANPNIDKSSSFIYMDKEQMSVNSNYIRSISFPVRCVKDN